MDILSTELHGTTACRLCNVQMSCTCMEMQDPRRLMHVRTGGTSQGDSRSPLQRSGALYLIAFSGSTQIGSAKSELLFGRNMSLMRKGKRSSASKYPRSGAESIRRFVVSALVG
jgi:hypothetical protein